MSPWRLREARTLAIAPFEGPLVHPRLGFLLGARLITSPPPSPTVTVSLHDSGFVGHASIGAVRLAQNVTSFPGFQHEEFVCLRVMSARIRRYAHHVIEEGAEREIYGKYRVQDPPYAEGFCVQGKKKREEGVEFTRDNSENDGD
eukprot:CAMPEP_0185764408 /NCGR_PEP_ID=MMETSP1174-20130828/23338_1 /TAXON_ID=35687 /ORGANISM="Dictyocha speculum, Strain CCMP1381" /LENGTH=144 /DNA_ID=CAMNT_0028446913 /DNA_START=914 /DNA_END=1348 /DNA_ORIENTATION=-